MLAKHPPCYSSPSLCTLKSLLSWLRSSYSFSERMIWIGLEPRRQARGSEAADERKEMVVCVQ